MLRLDKFVVVVVGAAIVVCSVPRSTPLNGEIPSVGNLLLYKCFILCSFQMTLFCFTLFCFVPVPQNLYLKPNPSESICCSTFHVFHFVVAPFAVPPPITVSLCVCVLATNVSHANDAHVCDAAFCLHSYFNPHCWLCFHGKCWPAHL